MSHPEFGCQDVDERCELALDGELDAAEQEAFWAHVQGCPACQRQVEMCRIIAQGLPLDQTLPPAEIEARSRGASVKAFLEIQGLNIAARQRLLWQRRLLLAIGWVGAALFSVWGAVLLGRVPLAWPVSLSVGKVRVISLLSEKLMLLPVYLIGGVLLIFVVLLLQGRVLRKEN